MATQPQIARIPVALPDDYVCPDPEPRDMLQSPTIDKTGYFVAHHFSGQPDTLVRSAGVVNYDPYDLNVRVEPDLCVAFGVDVPAIVRRNGYIIWEVGKPPDLVMEVASESTHGRDTGFKRGLYADLGIGEYWRVDPTGGDFYGYPLAGEELVNGAYRDLPVITEMDGMVWGYSPTLDLCLCWHPAWDWDVDDASSLRFYDRKTGRYLCDMTLVEGRLTLAEGRLALTEGRLTLAESALADERDARESAEAQLGAEQQARAAAEEHIRQLEAQLRRQQSEGSY